MKLANNFEEIKLELGKRKEKQFNSVNDKIKNGNKNIIIDYRGVSKSCCICGPVSANDESRMFVFFLPTLLFNGCSSFITPGLRNSRESTFLPIKGDVIFLNKSFLFLSIFDLPLASVADAVLVEFVSTEVTLSSSFCRSLMLRFGICCIMLSTTFACNGRIISYT